MAGVRRLELSALSGGTPSLLTLVLDEVSIQRYPRIRDRLVLVLWAVLESFGYGQLTVYWRLRGLVRYVCGQGDWGGMTHIGFSVAEPTLEEREAAAARLA